MNSEIKIVLDDISKIKIVLDVINKIKAIEEVRDNLMEIKDITTTEYQDLMLDLAYNFLSEYKGFLLSCKVEVPNE